MADRNFQDVPASQKTSDDAATINPGPNETGINSNRPNQRRRLLGMFAAAAGLVALAWFSYDMIARQGLVSTDNAYVGADTAQVTPLVSAAVSDVRVVDTQQVRRNDVLVVLDDTDQQIAVARAKAELAQAEQRFLQAQGAVTAAQGTMAARESEIGQARAGVQEARATLARTRTELDRRRALVSSGAISGEELTSASTAFDAARAGLSSAMAQLKAAEGTRAAAGGELRSRQVLVEGQTIQNSPDVQAARSRLEAAKLDLARTVIRAPVDGVVSNRQVQIGQRVAAGTPIMTLVPLAVAYVDANFKEDQLHDVRVGQSVELKSDYYGGDVVFHGRVIGLSGVTGAASALIPAQNATGNWIKVVQRLPVRIALNSRELKAHPLRQGLSIEATIDTRSDR